MSIIRPKSQNRGQHHEHQLALPDTKSQRRGQHHEHQLALPDPNHRTMASIMSISWPSPTQIREPRPASRATAGPPRHKSQRRGQHYEHQLALPDTNHSAAASIMSISWPSPTQIREPRPASGAPACPPRLESENRGQHHEHQLALPDLNQRTAASIMSISWPSPTQITAPRPAS